MHLHVVSGKRFETYTIIAVISLMGGLANDPLVRTTPMILISFSDIHGLELTMCDCAAQSQ